MACWTMSAAWNPRWRCRSALHQLCTAMLSSLDALPEQDLDSHPGQAAAGTRAVHGASAGLRAA